MIPEIGILVGLYVMARLIPADWRKVSRVLSVFTVVAALFVVADLSFRGLLDRGMLSALRGESSEDDETPEETIEGNQASQSASTQVTRADGGSITTNLGYGIALADNSSLKREWIAIHDSSIPATLEGTPGVSTIFIPDRYSSEFRYRSDFTLAAGEAIRAAEVRFLIFNVWGDHVQTLSYEEVLDLPKGEKKNFRAEWRVYSENDVEQHYASIVYVARVRLADGRVLRASEEPVLAEAKKFSEKFTPADLEPEEEKPSQKEKSAPNQGLAAGA